MKNIFVLVLFLISSNVLAEWKYIFGSENTDMFFIETTSIKKNNKIVRFWEKVNNHKGDVYNSGTYYSYRSYSEINCVEETKKILSIEAFKELDLMGEILSIKTDKEVTFIAPRTVGSIIMNYVCK